MFRIEYRGFSISRALRTAAQLVRRNRARPAEILRNASRVPSVKGVRFMTVGICKGRVRNFG
jgi:hypothetical protein